jgi:hypothetical protein
MKRLLPLLLSALGCLDTPPGVVVTTDAAGASDGAMSADAASCAGLDLVVESFDEADPVGTFQAVWDPGAALYNIAGGVLTMIASEGESQINSIDYYERTGALRFEEVTASGGGTVAFSVYGVAGTARMSIGEAVIDLYSGDDHTPVPRDPELDYFRLAFSAGEVQFDGSTDGEEWIELGSWPDDMTGTVRAAIAVINAAGTTTLTLGGINTTAGCI